MKDADQLDGWMEKKVTEEVQWSREIMGELRCALSLSKGGQAGHNARSQRSCE